MDSPAARVGDFHSCPKQEGGVPHAGGPILEGLLTVLIGDAPAARKGDRATCAGPPDTIQNASLSVLIGDQRAARTGDRTAHGGAILEGCRTVLIGDATRPPTDDEVAADLIAVVKKCDGGLNIWEKAKAANGGKDPQVKIRPSVAGSRGSVDRSTGVISINPDPSPGIQAQVLVMELSNLAAKAQFDKIRDDAAAGRLSRDEYVRANERVEYENSKNVLKAFGACSGSYRTTTSLKGAMRGAKDFDDYYDHILPQYHKDSFGKVWDDNFKKPFTQGHP